MKDDQKALFTRKAKPRARTAPPEGVVVSMFAARRARRMPYTKAELEAAWQAQYGHLQGID